MGPIKKVEPWYLLRVYPGKEEQVKNFMKSRLEAKNLQERVRVIVAPATENKAEAETGKFPGWVLVQMKFDFEVWALLRNTPGVEGFVGLGNEPTPFMGEGWKRYLDRSSTGELTRKVHSREEVIERAIREFELLDSLVTDLTDEEWARPVPRPETKDPWTVKDALAHITHWKADVARSTRNQPRPLEERDLNITAGNRLVYLRWHDRSPQEVLAWHRQVHEDVLAALREAPEAWFSGKERGADWPNDLDGHSAYHRVKDIGEALGRQAGE